MHSPFKSLLGSSLANQKKTKTITFRLDSNLVEDFDIALKIKGYLNTTDYLKEQVAKLINDNLDEIRKFKNEFIKVAKE